MVEFYIFRWSKRILGCNCRYFNLFVILRFKSNIVPIIVIQTQPSIMVWFGFVSNCVKLFDLKWFKIIQIELYSSLINGIDTIYEPKDLEKGNLDHLRSIESRQNRQIHLKDNIFNIWNFNFTI